MHSRDFLLYIVSGKRIMTIVLLNLEFRNADFDDA